MSTHVTRCPNCQTSFHVRSDQLLVAEGAVRCGSCLQVFIASDYFVDSKPISKKSNQESTKTLSSKNSAKTHKPTATSAEPKRAKKAAPATVKKLDDDDFDGLIHDDMELDEEDAIDLSDPTPKSPTNNGLLIDDDPYSDLNLSANSKPPKRKNAQALGLNLNDDNDFFSSHKGQTDDALFLIDEDEQAEDEIDESWANLLIEDDDPHEHITDDVAPSQPSPAKAKRTRVHDHSQATASKEASTEFEDNGHKNNKPTPQTNHDNDLLSEPLYVQGNWIPNDTPLELERPKSRTLQTFLFTLGVLLLMLTLAGQLAYFNISTWSSSPVLRPYYEYACQWVSCDLPAFRDPRQIKSQHLVVRSHPSQEGALVIDALLINQAPFEQPFPNIRMEFQDLQQTTVSSRVFSPADYLGGELSGRRTMPSQVPIHIAIDVIDPGANAVNYTLDVLN